MAIKWPKPTEHNASKTINIEFRKNNLYKPWFINLNNWKDHPLKVVKDPQNPKPKSNLYLLEKGNELIKPNKKQPIVFTKMIWSICHRNMAAGTAPIEIIKKLLFLKKLFIYGMPSKKPTASANNPEVREITNNWNALKNLNCINKSYKS